MNFGDTTDSNDQLKYFSAVENSSLVGVVCINKEYKIIRVNRIICERLEYSISELIGMDVNELLPEELRKKHQEKHLPSWYKHPETKPLNRPDMKIRKRDGSTLPVYILVLPYHRWKGGKMIDFDGPTPPETYGIAKIIFKQDLHDG